MQLRHTIRVIIAFLVLVGGALGQTLTYPALSTNNAFTGENSFVLFVLIPYTVSSLPPPTIGMLALVKDGTSGSDCTTGGGTSYAICASDGFSWFSIGGSGGGGSGNLSGTLTATKVPVASGTTTLVDSRITDDGSTVTINGGGAFSGFGLTPQAFSTFPGCDLAHEGIVAPVNDSTTTTWGATITGGGTGHVNAYCNGMNWSVMGATGLGSGAVTSVFGRTGAVVATNGDYSVSQVTGAAPLASPTFTGTVTMPAPTVSNFTGGGTQCVQVDNTGVLSRTGSTCGSGSGTVSSVTGDGSLITNSLSSGGVTLTVGTAPANSFWNGAWTQPAISNLTATFSSPLSLSTNTLSCPTCVVSSSPGAGIAHFAGATQTVTSSAVALGGADVSGVLTSGKGGTGVNNTATLTLGSSNQNWATLGTGVVLNTTTTGALSVIAASGSKCYPFQGSGGTGCDTPAGSGDTITSPNSTLNVGGTAANTTLDLKGAAGQIFAGATPALTATPSLGTDGSVAGSLQMANSAVAAHTIWASGATTTNTIKGFATAPVTGHIVTCTTSGTTCTLTDGGAPGGTGTVTVVGGGSLNSTSLVTGGGSTTIQTPAVAATMDSGGNISTPGTGTFAAGLNSGTAGATAAIGLNTTSGNNFLTTTSGATGFTWTLPAASGTFALTGADINSSNQVVSAHITGGTNTDLAIFNATGNLTNYGGATPCAAGNQVMTGLSPAGASTCTSLTNSFLPTVSIANGGTNATSAAAGTVPNATSGSASSWTATPTLGTTSTPGSITTLTGTGSTGSTTWGSSIPGSATVTILGPSSVPVTTDLIGCTTVGSTCTLTDSGVPGANVVRRDAGNVAFSNMTLDMSAATGTSAFRVPSGSGYQSTLNGAITYDSAAGSTHVRTNGADSLVAAFAAAPSGSKCLHTNGATGLITETSGDCAAGGGGDTITSPNSTLNVGGSSTNTTLDVVGAAGKILAGATPALTYTPTLGISGSAGTLAMFPATGNFTTTWGSAATASNTILGFATAPTTGHIIDCTTSSTTCTLHDSGVVTANVVNASSPAAGIAHFAGSTQTVTSSAIVAADIAANTITSAQVNNSIALTGTDINTSNQVTATHLAAALPINQGGTGTTSTLTGLMRGSASAMTAAELSGDATTSGSNAVTVVKVNGGSVPASAPLVGTNSSNQIVLATPFATNAQTATYQVLAADFSSYKTIIVASGTFTITLVASGSQPATGQSIRVVNYGSGVVTVARSGQNINGATTSITLNAGSASVPTSAFIVSDGTNYFATIDEGTTGTVTSIATTSPITGGTITGSGTIACASCVTSASSLTSTAVMTGAGTQGSQTPSATTTLDASGNLAVAAGGSVGSADTGTPKFTFATNKMTANQPVNIGVATNQIVTGTTTNLTTSNYPASSGAVTLTFPNTTTNVLGGNSDTTTTHVLHATATGGIGSFSAVVAGDLPSTLTSGTAITNAALTTPTIGGTATTGVTGTGKVVLDTSPTITTPSVTPQNIDCHTACSPTAAQLSNAIVSNMSTGGTGQANSAVSITGPTPANGMNFILILGAAEGAAATWTYASNAANIYLDGSTTAKTNIIFGNNAALATSVSCFTFPITGPGVALKCTTLAGTVTTS